MQNLNSVLQTIMLEALHASQMTRTELARVMKMKQPQLSRMLNMPGNNPSLRTVERFFDACGYSLHFTKEQKKKAHAYKA